jgi:hypothetical protein
VAHADREPVLKQIAVPHDYYFREMYLPQTTTGPGSVAWSPDGESLVYSMQGSLWIQRTDNVSARQVTNGPGYDYQPDWSSDGNHIVFVRYNRDAMELHVLEVESGTIYQLTSNGAVNVEPRWSPDGADLAYVSTEDTGRFHVRVGEIVNSKLQSRRLVKPRKSKVARYYYSEWDHQLSPSWSPDGKELIYVANPEVPYGTGAIWRISLDKGASPVLVRKEETSWKARPDWSPDGKRFIYASYLGRQWQQLWIAALSGNAEPFPLSYGNFDIMSPRWSPDAKRIAYISNRPGNTTIWIQDVVGGKSRELRIAERQYKVPVGQLSLALQNSYGEPVGARVSVLASDGRAYAPFAAWMHADDSYERSLASFETRYFHAHGAARITLPAGPATITVWRGLEHQPFRRSIDIVERQKVDLTVVPEALDMPAGWEAWTSGDVHVHMNYGGTYRNTPDRLIRQAQAEDLDTVFNLIVNKEQRIPDIVSFSPDPDSFSDENTLLVHTQEFHTSYWGHLGLLGLRQHLLLPDYSAYPGTGAASVYPDNATVSDMARQQGALVGYVHPFLAPPPNPADEAPLTNALPVDVAFKFLENFIWISYAMDKAGEHQDDMWDEQDGFYYDVLRLPNGEAFRLKVRSMVGLLPLCASTVFEGDLATRNPKLLELIALFKKRHPEVVAHVAPTLDGFIGHAGRRLLSPLTRKKLERILSYLLDENEFLGPCGIRSLSRHHLEHPVVFHTGGQEYRVQYLPAESNNAMFGGNSNWRGPVWMPVNVLVIRGLLNLYGFYGNELMVECPTGSGNRMNLFQVAEEISRRLTGIFLRDASGRRPVYGGTEKFQHDPHWRDLILFCEYFHGDHGAGLGASHQTGWTGLAASLLDLFGRLTAEGVLEETKETMQARLVREQVHGQKEPEPV